MQIKGKLSVAIVAGALAVSGCGGPTNNEKLAQSVEEASVEVVPDQPENAAKPKQMSEEQRLALSEVDPEMKAATDYVGLLINQAGYLCAEVSNAEQTNNGNFKVTCVERRNGRGRVAYLVNGKTNRITPL